MNESIHLLMSWAPYVIGVILISYIIWRHPFFRLPGLHRNAGLLFFILKIIASLTIWYIYSFYYPQREYADIWKYFDDSEVMYDALDHSPGDYFRMVSGIGIDDRIQHTYFDKMQHWDQQFENNLFNDSHTIIRFNALLRLISGGNYHTHALFMCLLAFIGLCALYRWIYPVLFRWKKLIAFILFISPSLLFWSSGVLKEGILFFALGLLIYHTWRFRDDKQKSRISWIVISVLLLAMTKLYMLVFVVPPLLLGLHLQKNPRYALLKSVMLLALLIGIALTIHVAKPSFSPFRIIALKQKDFLNLARGGTYVMNDEVVVYLRPDQHDRLDISSIKGRLSIADNTDVIYWEIANDFKDTLYKTFRPEDTTTYVLLSDNPSAGSLMEVRPLEPDPVTVLAESPIAMGRSVFRPYPWEIRPVMILPSTLENLLLLALIFLLFVYNKKASSKSIFWFCVCYAIIALTVTGLTTPVLGALVRYRITAIPFLLFAILLCIDRQKLVNRIPFLERIL